MGDGNFWAIVGLAATISTGLATGISTLAALWWRRQDRKLPDWVWHETGSADGSVDSYGNESESRAWGVLANAGEGRAYRLVIRGDGCEAYMTARVEGSSIGIGEIAVGLRPTVEPGEQFRVHAHCLPEDWSSASVVVEWTQPPTWKKKRVTEVFPLSEIADAPEKQDATDGS